MAKFKDKQPDSATVRAKRYRMKRLAEDAEGYRKRVADMKKETRKRAACLESKERKERRRINNTLANQEWRKRQAAKVVAAEDAAQVTSCRRSSRLQPQSVDTKTSTNMFRNSSAAPPPTCKQANKVCQLIHSQELSQHYMYI